jgi:hypothetical protein
MHRTQFGKPAADQDNALVVAHGRIGEAANCIVATSEFFRAQTRCSADRRSAKFSNDFIGRQLPIPAFSGRNLPRSFPGRAPVRPNGSIRACVSRKKRAAQGGLMKVCYGDETAPPVKCRFR